MNKMHFYATVPLAKLSIMVGNSGWRLTLEKRNQIVLGVRFHHQRVFMPLEGSSVPDLVVENILTLQNYRKILHGLVIIPAFDQKLSFTFFFQYSILRPSKLDGKIHHLHRKQNFLELT